MNKQRLYLVDATAFCYRAFYALKGLATSFGQPTNAIYGFINILNKVLKENRPELLAVCFDVSRDTFRARKFADYKINRPAMPEGLTSQIPLIKQIVKAYGIALVEKEGFEADDIIATLAERAKKSGLCVTVVSSDKDILQLVDENTVVFSPYKDTGTFYDTKKVLERFGIEPAQIPDLIALMGDSVDNIPGVPGVGEKTAGELIREFGGIEELIANIHAVRPDKIKQSLFDNIEQVKLSHDLALLARDVPLDFDLDGLKAALPDYQALFKIFKYLEFKKFLKDLPVSDDKKEVNSSFLQDKSLLEVVRPGVEAVLYGDKFDNLVFLSGEKIFRVEAPSFNTKNILASPVIKKIGHDLKKLKVSLNRDSVTLEGLYFDTMIAAYLLNPSRPGYALGDLALDYLGEALPESIDGTQAVDLIRDLQPKLEGLLQEKSLIDLFRDTEMPLSEVLAQMEIAGIKLDTCVLAELAEDIEKRLDRLISDIYRLSGGEFNINSPKQLREILFNKLKLPVIKRAKTGPSTDEEVLHRLAEVHELPQYLLEYRRLTKLKNTYVDTLPKLIDPKTQRVHTLFNQTGTETGRLSSSDPNLQNIPVRTEVGSRIRKAIIAYDDKSFLLSCDYSQIELRILAHLSHDENLIQAFNKDEDIHKFTAALIYNLKEGDVDNAMREVAKRINFGIIYGLSSWGLSRDLKLPVEQAQDFIDAYFVRYPKVKEYIEEQIRLAVKQGFVTTILGRRRYLPEINSKNQAIRQLAERQAVNTPIQGSASDLIKLAMVRIYRRMEEKKAGSKMLLQIHDELVFNVPADELEWFAPLVKDSMENILKLSVPVRVSMKRGRNWLEMTDVG